VELFDVEYYIEIGLEVTRGHSKAWVRFIHLR